MTKLDRLNVFLSERLSAAVNEIIYTVSMTMKEYEEETARIRKENLYLKEMLKLTRCPVTQDQSGVVSSLVVPTLSSGQQDCNSSLGQETETQENQTEHRCRTEETSSIKTEQTSYPADAVFESDTRQSFTTQPDYTEEPLQSASVLNTHAAEQVIDSDIPVKVKVETVNTHSAEAMDNTDASAQSWSLQNWDVITENGDYNRTQQASSEQPCGIEGAHFAESTSQNRPVEFQAAFSYSNRIICNNVLHCTSKHCEMQKRTIAKSSPVWKYFTLKEGDCSKAVCLMCQTVISRGVKEYTTSALLKHLRMKHGKC